MTFRGIIQITGELGVGKTSFALGYPGVTDPRQIAVFNFDVKPYPNMGAEDDPNLGYRHYGSYLWMLTDLSSPNPELALVEQVLHDFELAKGAKVVIFDSWEIFTKGLLTWTLINANKLKQFSGDGKMQRMAKLGHASRIEVSYLDAFMRIMGVEVVFIINHLAPEYAKATGDSETGVRTGRMIPEASDRLNQKASGRFWLKHNPDHSCPIGVVLKDPGVHTFEPGRGIVARRALPDRLSPEALRESMGDISNVEISLWDIIAHYMSNPVGARLLHGFEKATPEEFAYVAGTLTPTQQAVWEKNQQLALTFGAHYDDSLIKKIKDMAANGGSFVDIFKELKESYPELTLAQVKETMEF